MLSMVGPNWPVALAIPVLTGMASWISRQSFDRMQASNLSGFEVAFPHPRVEVTLYHLEADVAWSV